MSTTTSLENANLAKLAITYKAEYALLTNHFAHHIHQMEMMKFAAHVSNQTVIFLLIHLLVNLRNQDVFINMENVSHVLILSEKLIQEYV